MTNSSDQNSGVNRDTGLIFKGLSDQVLLKWEKQIRAKIPLASKLSQPVLIDTLPLFLQHLAEALTYDDPRGLATESNNVAQEHGGERARVTRYGPDQIIQEYVILRDVVEQALGEVTTLTVRENAIIRGSFDQAIQDAMVAYFLVHRRVQDQFVATLSHDLRNPLGAAKLAAELINRELASPLDAARQEKLASMGTRVVGNIKRADRMIQDLLDTNVMGVGERLFLHIEDCDAKAIAESVIADLSETDRKRVKLVAVNAPGKWDRDALWRALENLVGNAFKYGTDHTPVTITIQATLGRVILLVHNEGSHIPVEERELLFQAYNRSQSAKKSGKKGWGLGLALARGVAESHGGSLGVDSSPESGTTFNIDVPADSTPFQVVPIS